MTFPLPTLPVFFHSFIASSDFSLTNLQGESSTQQFQTNDRSITFCINGRLLTEHNTLFAMVNKVPVGDKCSAIPSLCDYSKSHPERGHIPTTVPPRNPCPRPQIFQTFIHFSPHSGTLPSPIPVAKNLPGGRNKQPLDYFRVVGIVRWDRQKLHPKNEKFDLSGESAREHIQSVRLFQRARRVERWSNSL